MFRTLDRRHKSSGLLWLLPILGLSGAVTAPGSTSADVTVAPALVNLGAVGHGGTKTFKFTIQNHRSTPYAISGVKPSCDCMRVRLSQRALGPGESREGHVTIRWGRGFGDFHKYIEILPAEADQPTLRVEVLARFHPGVRISKLSFDVESSVTKRLPEFRDDVTLHRTRPTGKPIRVENVRCDTPYLEVFHEPISADEVRFRVEVLPEHPRGRVRGQLLADVEGLPLQISIRGMVHQGIQVKPDHFNFSRLDNPEAAQKVVDLIPLDVPFKLIKVDIRPRGGSPRISVDVEPRPDGGVRLVARPVAPFTPGQRLTGEVWAFTDHPDCPQIKLNFFGFFAKPQRT